MIVNRKVRRAYGAYRRAFQSYNVERMIVATQRIVRLEAAHERRWCEHLRREQYRERPRGWLYV